MLRYNRIAKGYIMTKEEQKRERKYNYLGTCAIIVFFGCTIYMVGGVIIPRGIKEKEEKAKQAVIDNKVEQYEQTLPYYKEYLQTKEQITQYRDSLQRVIK